MRIYLSRVQMRRKERGACAVAQSAPGRGPGWQLRLHKLVKQHPSDLSGPHSPSTQNPECSCGAPTFMKAGSAAAVTLWPQLFGSERHRYFDVVFSAATAGVHTPLLQLPPEQSPMSWHALAGVAPSSSHFTTSAHTLVSSKRKVQMVTACTGSRACEREKGERGRGR
jgi:hypothetical protein